MSAAGALGAAARAALEGLEGLNGAYPGPPVQASFPYALVECGAEADWSHKSGLGRELRLAVTIRDSGESSQRALALSAAAEGVVAQLQDVPAWRLVSLHFLRSRNFADSRGGARGWVVTSEYRARLLAEA